MQLTNSLRRHEKLLLLACRRNAATCLQPDDVRQLADPVLGARWLALAERHDVLGLVLTTLQQAPAWAEVPAERAGEILRPLRFLERQSLLWDMERRRLSTVFERSGLDPLWLKGGALRGTVYSRSVERRLGDLDLLIVSDQLEDAVRALETAGYESRWSDEETRAFARHHFHLRLNHQAGFIVEVHWGLSSPSSQYRLDAAEFLRRSRVQTASGDTRIRVPCPEDMLLHCAEQSLGGTFSSLRRQVDLDRIIAHEAEFDWEYLERAARRSRLDGALALSLQLARSTLGTPLPVGYVERLAASRAMRVHTSLLCPRRSHIRQSWRPAGSRLLAFWLSPSWPARRRLLAQVLASEDRPLAWIWKEAATAADHAEGWLTGPREVLKAALYQLWIYARGVARLATVNGRQELQFWP